MLVVLSENTMTSRVRNLVYSKTGAGCHETCNWKLTAEFKGGRMTKSHAGIKGEGWTECRTGLAAFYLNP